MWKNQQWERALNLGKFELTINNALSVTVFFRQVFSYQLLLL